MQKLGFIGMGNMAQAIAGGFLSKGLIDGSNLLAYAPNQDKLRANAQRLGFTPCTCAAMVAEQADTILIACKPYQVEDVLAEIKHLLKGKALLSVALGWDFARYSAVLDPSTRIQFIMPNTPSMVGEGVLLFEQKNTLYPHELEEIKTLFAAIGIVQELPSHLMGIGGAVTGCGPAFVDLMLEAFADAAVMYGIPRPMAYRLVSQMVLGTAKLQLETGSHPGALKDAVCSPAGTTICGVSALEHAGFRAACIDAISAVMNKK